MVCLNPFEEPDLLRDRLTRYDFDKQILLECKERHKSRKEFTEGILTGLIFGILGNLFVSLIFEFAKNQSFVLGAMLIVVTLAFVIILFLFEKHRKKEIKDIKKFEDTLRELEEYMTEGKRYLHDLDSNKKINI